VNAPNFRAALELKKTDSEKGLDTAIKNALRQIDDRRYFEDVDKASGVPCYKIGIGICKKICKVVAVLESFG
jgi:hypothetical protein